MMNSIDCTFYRPEEVNINEFQNIVGKLEYDFSRISMAETIEEVNLVDIRYYVERLTRIAKPLQNNPKMYFLGLGEPDQMPGDARVDFFYRPTYLGTAFIIKALLLYPDLFELLEEHIGEDTEINHKEVFCGMLLGCTGRDFAGHGYDSLRGLIETMEVFVRAGGTEFVAKYPDYCKEFTEVYTKAIEMLKERIKAGTLHDAWGTSYEEEAKKVIMLDRVRAQ